jgi:murein DD-endopeptidase MepM/ murein hydrolase activator NlpD
MKIIFLSDFCKRTGSLDICLSRAVLALVVLAVGVLSLTAWVGFELGQRTGNPQLVDDEVVELRQLLRAERRTIAGAKAEQRAHLDALAMRIADLQAHLMRLDALGGRLVEVGKLDDDEFDFAADPPLGGLDVPASSESVSTEELSADLMRIEALLEDREEKLLTLERVLMTRDLMAEVTPSGKPVKKGWLSSGFGRRTDPFNGKKSYHRGVDFAGKPGADIIAVASGVVLRAERASGYGNFVEIRHAEGYSTLYAHNKKNLVSAGEVVSKGQTIALLGSTGRSSGPHVHFEVHRDGKIVNPIRFVR